MNKITIIVFFIVNAAAAGDLHFLPDQVYSDVLMKGQEVKKDPKVVYDFLNYVHQRICIGTKPLINVTRTIDFKPNVRTGIPLDIAANQSLKQIAMARYFYQNDYFYRSGGKKRDFANFILKHGKDNKGTGEISMSDYRHFEHERREIAVDMQMLVDGFTFHLPKEVSQELYGSINDDLQVNRLGWSTGEFRPSEAVDFKEYIWRYTLIHDTQLKEAPLENGQIRFQITWTPNLFCKYGVSVYDLVAR